LFMLKTLLLLSVLCAPTSSLCLRVYPTRSGLLCNMAIGVDKSEPDYSPTDGWGSLLQSAEYLSSSSSLSAESSREKRTSSPANYRFMSRTKLRGQMLRNNGDRRSRLTLSLDVPTNIMNVLFDVAKAKNLRAKAAENARLLAQIGRRK
uniref:Urocortin 3, like n=2 Tax=Oryzias melastigma TaxID=30732 RepID=A0A3B3D9T9_ORYME